MNQAIRKYCFISGISEGIGHFTALGMLAHGYHIVATVSPGKNTDTVLGQFNQDQHHQIRLYPCDLSVQAQVKEVCQKIVDDIPSLDVCIHNAGVVYGKGELTVDGIEKQLAVNYLAPFMISHLLLPRMATNGRIIFTSTRAHYRASIDIEQIHLLENYGASKAYGRSKLALITFFVSLAKKLKHRPVIVLAYHPGLVRTGIGNKHMNKYQETLWNLMKILGRSAEKAAASGIYLATTPLTTDDSGSYYANKRKSRPSKKCFDASFAEKLWKATEELTNIDSQKYLL